MAAMSYGAAAPRIGKTTGGRGLIASAMRPSVPTMPAVRAPKVGVRKLRKPY